MISLSCSGTGRKNPATFRKAAWQAVGAIRDSALHSARA
jgi:hypothetical protein